MKIGINYMRDYIAFAIPLLYLEKFSINKWGEFN